MGLIRRIRTVYAQAKLVKELVKAEVEDTARARAMTREEAAELGDEALWTCVTRRLLAWEELPPAGPLRTAYTVDAFDREVQNGGLCQYFVNASRETAPYLEEALEQIGAVRCRALFHAFVTDNGIDVTRLDSFEIEAAEEFEAQNRRYPFDAFDETLYALYGREPLEDLCAAYVRTHLEEFFP